eukprot:5118540-Prymnesium_polylepis.2
MAQLRLAPQDLAHRAARALRVGRRRVRSVGRSGRLGGLETRRRQRSDARCLHDLRPVPRGILQPADVRQLPPESIALWRDQRRAVTLWCRECSSDLACTASRLGIPMRGRTRSRSSPPSRTCACPRRPAVDPTRCAAAPPRRQPWSGFAARS